MDLVNFVAFLILKILYNLVSRKYFLNANDCRHVQRNLTFSFDVVSKSRIDFVSFLVYLALENVVSFTKPRFYWKWTSGTMRNYVETFRTNIGHSLA